MTWASKNSIRRLRPFHILAGAIQQIRELAKLFRRELAPLAAVQFAHGLVEFRQQAQAFRGDTRLDHAAVLRFARASDQAAGFHTVEQAGDVRIARDQPASDLATSQSAFSSAAQDAQNIVLRSGKAKGLEQGFGAARKGVGGAHQADKDASLQAILGAAFQFGLPLHETTILVTTTIVKRNVSSGLLRALRFSLCPLC